MTKEQFVQLHKHHFLGLVADSIGKQRSGGDLGLFLTQAIEKIDTRLGQIFDQLQPKPAATAAQPGGQK